MVERPNLVQNGQILPSSFSFLKTALACILLHLRGYVFKMGAEGLGYYKDIRAQPLVPARLNAENSENLGATNNSGPAEETIGKGTIAFANANQSAKESQGSIDAGSVTLVNQIMYELD
jgi:hypothetical protein